MPVLPTLAVDLKGTAAEAFWTGTSYLLAHAVLQPFIASLSDVFGRRELLIPSILFFAVGSIICGLAHNFPVMLTGRVLQGFGGAGIITLSQLVYADLVPLRLRPKYFTMVLGAWALGSLLGPLVGGLFVEHVTWRWCFWLNLPVCTIALPMAVFFLGALSKPKTDLLTKLRTIDWLGNTLFLASLTSLLTAISWAGISYPWSAYQTILPLVLGATGLLLSIIYETRLARNPFLSKNIFKSPSVIASYTAALLQGLALYTALYYSSFYFAAAHFFSPVRTGLSIFPATTLMLPGSAVVSALIARTGRYRWAIWAGFALSTLSTSLFALLWDETTRTPVWAVCECLFGLGMGMILSSVNFSTQAAVEPQHAGSAAAMYAFCRSVGMAVGVAVGGTVFQNVMKAKLRALGVRGADEWARHAEEYIAVLKGMGTSGAEGRMREHVMSGYVAGFRGVWITMTALCATGLVVSLCIRKGSLDGVSRSEFTVREVGGDDDGETVV